MKTAKKTLCALLAVLLIASLCAAPALADTAPDFQYELTISDKNGNALNDLSGLSKGDDVYVEVILHRTDITGSYVANALEFTFTTYGLDYNDDNVKFDPSIDVNFRYKGTNKDPKSALTVAFMDVANGLELANPLTAVKCSLKVTDPDTAAITLTTALVYIGVEQYTPAGEAELKLNPGKGEISGNDPSGTYRTGMKVTLPSAAREGYNFKGWSDGSTTYDADSTYTVSSSVTLKAVWECRHLSTTAYYEISLRGEGGKHSVERRCDECDAVTEDAKLEDCSFTGTVSKEAGCKSDGLMTYTCDKCGNTYSKTITGGHKYKDSYEKDSKEHWKVCSVCNEEEPGTRGDHEFDDKGCCKVCGYGCEHSFNVEIVKKATATEDGIRKYTCSKCGYSYTERIPATGEDDGRDDGRDDKDNKGETKIDEKPQHVDAPELNAADHVNYLMGYSDGTIRPTANITRAEAATIFFRLLTDESRARYMSTENSFSDVASGDWYNTAVSTLSNAGIINGYSDGSFRPNNNITRAEMATIIAKFAQFEGTGRSFSDISGHWAQKNIETTVYNGWINGYEDGTFRPDRNITRAETVTMINRVLGRGVSSAEALSQGMNTWSDNMDVSAWYYLHVQEASNNHNYRIERSGEVWNEKIADIDWTSYQY